MSDGEGVRGGEVSKYKNTPVSSYAAVDRTFSEPRIFLLMTIAIADSPLVGQSASGLNFYDDSGHSFYPVIFPSASGLKHPLAG